MAWAVMIPVFGARLPAIAAATTGNLLNLLLNIGRMKTAPEPAGTRLNKPGRL